MTKELRICIIPGDGIGPEVTSCAQRVLEALSGRNGTARFSFEERPAGHGAFLACGEALPAETLENAKKMDGILLGALDVAQIPAGVPEPLTQLRNALAVNASVRPARSLPGQPGNPIDVIVVREVTEGLYSGIEYKMSPDVVHGIRLITRKASQNVARVAFELARDRQKRVTAVHKIGILKLTDGLFLESVRQVAAEYPDVELRTANVDACAMELVRHPGDFDVVLSTNAFGDILSDVAIGLGAGLGLAPSGCVGDRWAYFEPVHGTAPDIAGKGIANPIATILTAAMMLRHLRESDAAASIETAVERVLEAGKVRTGDLGGKASSAEMTDAIIAELS